MREKINEMRELKKRDGESLSTCKTFHGRSTLITNISGYDKEIEFLNFIIKSK